MEKDHGSNLCKPTADLWLVQDQTIDISKPEQLHLRNGPTTPYLVATPECG